MSPYASKFIQLSWFVPESIATDSKKAMKFLKGMMNEIFDRVAMMKPATYVKAFENAKLAEELFAIR